MGRNPANPDGVGRAIRADEQIRQLRLRAGDIGGVAFLNDDGAVYTEPDVNSVDVGSGGGGLDVHSDGGGNSHNTGGGGWQLLTDGGGIEIDSGGGGIELKSDDGSITINVGATGSISIQSSAGDGIFFDASTSTIDFWADHINFHSGDITGLP